MADDPDLTEVTIRNPSTLEEKTVAKAVLPFWPGWVRIDTLGRPVGAPTDSSGAPTAAPGTPTDPSPTTGEPTPTTAPQEG